MKNGLARFEFYLAQLQTLLEKSSKQKNPALWLYRNNIRTPLFMLEGLCKLYAGLHNKNRFSKLKEHFKLLEDILGGIDYYDAYATEFAKNKSIPATAVNYLQAQTREKIQSMNELLVENNWLDTTSGRIKKIKKKLKEADWLKEDDEVKAMNKFYADAIITISEFMKKTTFHFDNVEADVHELRRKLRWLSIYPQALRGVIQLSNSKTAPKFLTKYLTREIINSPYNKMPDSANCKHFLLLDKNRFYALSWMISELGKLKDNGLRIIALKEALQQTGTLNDDVAFTKTYQVLGKKQLKLQSLLDMSEELCKQYFKEQNLIQLAIGTAEAK